MRNLYARIVLWLIRPALELQKAHTKAAQKANLDALIEDARNNGPVIRQIRKAL